ncbi:hypothetical protein G741_00002 [Escherichia coli HVH 78 (4-2735946)]|nr:hypothetical protein G741_00002 [Escherichia coli HVH 78 (4-2735946)]
MDSAGNCSQYLVKAGFQEAECRKHVCVARRFLIFQNELWSRKKSGVASGRVDVVYIAYYHPALTLACP